MSFFKMLIKINKIFDFFDKFFSFLHLFSLFGRKLNLKSSVINTASF